MGQECLVRIWKIATLKTSQNSLGHERFFAGEEKDTSFMLYNVKCPPSLSCLPHWDNWQYAFSERRHLTHLEIAVLWSEIFRVYKRFLEFKNSVTKSNLILSKLNFYWPVLKERNSIVTYSCTQHKFSINTTQRDFLHDSNIMKCF